MAQPPPEPAGLFLELGFAVIALATLARIANALRFSSIPLYLLIGLAFGRGGLAPLPLSQAFIHTGAEIGVLLLLFMLGLEYTGVELQQKLRGGLMSGIIDFGMNFPPGFIAALVLGWSPIAAVLLGGVTYISSSGIVAKLLAELGRMSNPETSTILTVLVLEDLAMAVYLPLVGVLLAGGSATKVIAAVCVAVALVSLFLYVAVRFGHKLSRFAAHESDEIILLTVLGTVLVVAGLSQRFQVSAAIGAFLVGIAVSGPLQRQAHRLFSPLRDFFAAIFFLFFGLEIDPATLPGVLPAAAALCVVTALTKIISGYWAVRRETGDRPSGLRAGTMLVARGEFSIVIAGLGAAIEPRLGSLAAAYVLFAAVAGPIVTRATR